MTNTVDGKFYELYSLMTLLIYLFIFLTDLTILTLSVMDRMVVWFGISYTFSNNTHFIMFHQSTFFS